MQKNRYNKRIQWTIALGMLFLVHFVFANPGNYPIYNFTPTDYKAGIQNIDFAQNRDMSIFVANNLGILKYNGKDWIVNSIKSGKKERSLAFDPQNNRLYSGSQGAIGYYTSNWDYISLTEKIPIDHRDFDEVWDVYVLNSKVYFCTFSSIYVYENDSISTLTNPLGFDRTFQLGGQLITQSQDGKLYEIKDRKLSSFHIQKDNSEILAGLVQQSNGYLMFYKSGKIEFSTTLQNKDQFAFLVEELKDKYINHVLDLSDRRIAISTQTAGLFLFDLQSKTIENIRSENGLLSNACLRTFQDHSGNLWVGMQNGIALIDINSSVRFIKEDIELQGSGYDSFETEEGIYYTTSNGIYFLEKNKSKSQFLEGTEGPAYSIKSIAGNLYACHHTGLFQLEQGRAIQIANIEGLWDIKQLRSDPAFLIGGTYTGLFLFKLMGDFKIQAVQKIEGFNESSRFFEEDRNGSIWVGQFYKGLYKLNLAEDKKTTKVIDKSGENDLVLKDQIILSKINNRLYLATKSGLYEIDETTDEIKKSELFYDIIGDQQIHLIAQDQQKNIHVFTENLIGYFKQISNKNYVFLPSSLYQLRYSFNNDLLNYSTNTQKGIIFNANEGFLHYYPEKEEQLIVHNPLLVTKVYSATEDSLLYQLPPFDTRPEKPVELTVSHRAKLLQFDVESFRFRASGNQQFRYFLEGFDEVYGDWTLSSTKEYTNLKEGNYTFFVQCRNDLGELVTSNPLGIKVKPPFYKSLIAKTFYVLLGIGIILLFIRIQNERFRKKAKASEDSKKEELAKKQQELEHIEHQKEMELQQLKEEKLQSELNHLQNLLASSTMNLVVKNEFIDKIKKKLKELKKKEEDAETKDTLQHLVNEIDITLKLQEDWEKFEHHFDQVHGEFLSRLRLDFPDLSPNEQKLCTFLRLNLSTKEIANLMNISQRGVEVARFRLRKKLKLEKGQNLSKYVLDY